MSCFARAYHFKNNKTQIFADSMAAGLKIDIEQATIVVTIAYSIYLGRLKSPDSNKEVMTGMDA